MTDANQASLIQLVATIIGAVVTVAGLIFNYLKSQQAVIKSQEAVDSSVKNAEALEKVHVQMNGHTEALIDASTQVAALVAKGAAEKVAAGEAKVALAESQAMVAQATAAGKAEGLAEAKGT